MRNRLIARLAAILLLITAASACAGGLPTKFTVKFCLNDAGTTNTSWNLFSDNVSDPIKVKVVVQAPSALKDRSTKIEAVTIKLDQDASDGKVSGSHDVALLHGVHKLYILQGDALGDTGGSISVQLRKASATQSPTASSSPCA